MSNFEQSNFELSNFELSKFDIHPGEAERRARSGKQPVRYACGREARARGQRYLLQPEEVKEAVFKVKVQEGKGCWGGSSFHPFFQDCVRGREREVEG